MVQTRTTFPLHPWPKDSRQSGFGQGTPQHKTSRSVHIQRGALPLTLSLLSCSAKSLLILSYGLCSIFDRLHWIRSSTLLQLLHFSHIHYSLIESNKHRIHRLPTRNIHLPNTHFYHITRSTKTRDFEIISRCVLQPFRALP
jgi:hypothetical protein